MFTILTLSKSFPQSLQPPKMDQFSRFELLEHHLCPSYFLEQTSIFSSPPQWLPILEEDLDLLSFAPAPRHFDAVADLIQIHRASARRRHLQTLSDRVSALELRLAERESRKYTWTAEIKSGDDDRKYKWTAERKGSARSYEVTAEIKRKGAIEQTYTVKVSSGDGESAVEKIEKKEKKKKKSEVVKEKGKKSVVSRIVEVEEPTTYHGGIVLRQVGW